MSALSSGTHTVCSFCLWPPLCIDEGVIQPAYFHPLTPSDTQYITFLSEITQCCWGWRIQLLVLTAWRWRSTNRFCVLAALWQLLWWFILSWWYTQMGCAVKTACKSYNTCVFPGVTVHFSSLLPQDSRVYTCWKGALACPISCSTPFLSSILFPVKLVCVPRK